MGTGRPNLSPGPENKMTFAGTPLHELLGQRRETGMDQLDAASRWRPEAYPHPSPEAGRLMHCPSPPPIPPIKGT